MPIASKSVPLPPNIEARKTLDPETSSLPTMTRVRMSYVQIEITYEDGGITATLSNKGGGK